MSELMAANYISHSNPMSSSQCFLALTHNLGDSMSPTLEPNQPFLIDLSVGEFDGEGIYVFRVDGGLFVKRLQQIASGEIQVISDNRVYEEWTLKPEMNAQVIGRMTETLVGDVVEVRP